MIPITLCFVIFAACFALNHGQLTGGGDLPSVNFSDFPPPVPNAPDLQRAGLYQNRNSLGSNSGRLSGALSDQNMIMEPSGGMDFGLGNQNTAFGRQSGGLGSGLNQNPSSMGSLGGNSFGSLGSIDSGMGSMGMRSVDSGMGSMGMGSVDTGMGSMGMGSFDTGMGSMGMGSFDGGMGSMGMGSSDGGMGSMGMGGMDVGSGFGNPSGSFGEIPSSGLDQGMGLSNSAGQMTGQGAVAPSVGPYQANRNYYMAGPTPIVPGARGVTRNISSRPMTIMRPPPIILLPPPQRRRGPFSLFQRRPRVNLIPIGPPVPLPFTPGQF
eukprot:XP_011426360.1 PREDICTED: uncharacterized PE-PGRS family protein PE_PGRS54 isoform X3 [Crassostrea gigas]